ncbi:MAG: hypothetical protein LBO65_09080 [Spirochaetaceae bacterium]|jgi:hypothetical protein|nr:hypothetical protein [Spirochaetaceae bacterium]
MFKKSLCLGSVTLVLLVLFALAGCSNPAGSSPAGQRGPVIPATAGQVTDEELVELYVVNNTVRITTGSTGSDSTVFGVVPPGKTLEIAGSVAIEDGLTLDVQGVLHILENGELFLEDPDTSVLLVDRSGAVRVDGFVYEEPAFFPVTGGLAQGVSFGPNGGVTLGAAVPAAEVDRYFTLVNRVKWASPTPLGDDLEKWVPGKTLLLNADSNIPTIDISSKGALVITGNLGIDGAVGEITATLDDGATLTANGSQVLITETAVLELETGTSTLAGKFKIKGTLSAGAFKTAVIPPGVDLTEATLRASVDNAIFQFPPSSSPDATVVRIKTIAMSNNLAIANTKGLVVDLIRSVGATAKALTLPNNVSTTVNLVDISPANLSVKGEDAVDDASYAIFKPAAIYGIAGTSRTIILTGKNILLENEVDVASNIIISSPTLGLKPLGVSPGDQLDQLARINGGTVALGGANLAVAFKKPTVINTIIQTTGAVSFEEDTTLNRGIAGTGGYSITAGKKLTVGQYGEFTVGTLTIGPGVYAAENGAFTISNGGAIASTVPGATLSIGDTANPAKLSLKVNNTPGGTFTPAVVATKLNGAIGGLVVPASGIFALGGNAEIVLGDGATIGIDNGGKITLVATTSKISGFTTETLATVGPALNGDVFKAAAADAGKPWEAFGSGLTLTGTFTITDHVLTATGTPEIGGTATTGGILRRDAF